MLSFRGEQHVAQADPVLLERILRNLVSNAIRYSDDGGVLVSCRLRQGRLLVQVWDSGIGISEATLPRIFDEFYQVSSSRPLEPHQRKGLGLGLAIVKRLAALMDAPVTVRSRVGHGTVFSLTVPVGKANAPGRGAAGSSSTCAAGPDAAGPCLLVVVEDEAAVREGLVVLLQAWGASVHVVRHRGGVLPGLAGQRAALQPPDLAAGRLPPAREPDRPGRAGGAARALAGPPAARHHDHRQQPGRP